MHTSGVPHTPRRSCIEGFGLRDLFLTLLAVSLQEKELAKEMDGLSMGAQVSSSAAGGVGGASDGVKKYNKSSFFDEISCDVLDRAAGAEGADCTC